MKRKTVFLLFAFAVVALAQTTTLQDRMTRLEYYQYLKDGNKTANLLTFRAMNYAALQTNKREWQQDAVEAVLQIAGKIYQQNPGQVRLTLEGVKAKCTSALARDRAEKLLKQVADYQMAQSLAGKSVARPLFDGKSLDGWEGNSNCFRIVKGAIVGGSLPSALPHNEFLCSTKEYADFELSVQCKLLGDPAKANAGIQIRSQRIPNHYEMIGYQADMGQSYWGSLYDESRRNKMIAEAKPDVIKKTLRKNGWNTYIMRCIGPRVQLWLNGVQTVDYVEPDASLRQKGFIALQIHGGASAEVWYKDITMTEYPSDVPFRVHVIDSTSAYEAGTIVDVNNDGRLDLFCGGNWFSAPDWQKHHVRDVEALGGYHVDFAAFPMDVDKDGWTDIVNGSWHNKNVFWVRNPGTAGGDFSLYSIDEPGNLETLVTADLNADQIPDILPNTVSSLVWYELQAPGRPGTWKKHELTKEAAGHGLGAGDINKDGKVDIITQKGWLEQVDAASDNWIWRPEFKLPSTSIPMLVHDVDEDGDNDIIYGLGHDYGLYWLEQTAKTNGQITWQQHVIDDTWSQPHFMLLADLNNDGRKELVTGKRYYAHNGHDPGEDHPICVYYYDFNLSDKQWHRHVVHEGDRVGFGIYSAAADVDQDGDIDLLAPGKSGLYLLENLYK
jgi:hypothetical protein